MIQSILDNDLYKFTMQNAVLKLYPKVKVSYKFYNRGNTKFPNGFAEKLREEIKKMEKLYLTFEEKKYFQNKTSSFLDPFYFDFLQGYRFNSKEIGVIQNGGKLDIQISGYWYRTILWEVPLMAIISELYFKMTKQQVWDDNKIKENNLKKASFIKFNALPVAELGTRRRYSFEEHKNIVQILRDYAGNSFVGTSNVYMGFIFNIDIKGTQAHEWFMFHSVLNGFKSANISALNAWKRVYKGYLGTALTDTFTTKEFFRVFSKEYAELFTSIRHDSGNPFDFAKEAIKHYKSLKINPKNKTIIFSDGLNLEKAEKIAIYCRKLIKYSFGIGTFLTNDVGVTPLNMVIKLDTVTLSEDGDFQYCIKLSDSSGKHTGNIETIKLALLILRLSNELKQYETKEDKIEINYKLL